MEQLAGPAVVSTALVVKKRNGQHVLFFEARILHAIERACKAHLGLPQESALDATWSSVAHTVTQQVVAWCHAQRQPILFLEDIQDAVIAQMRAAGHAELADRYAMYRREQERKRFETQRLLIQKRDGRIVSFKPEKIAIAIGKAFAAGRDDALSPQEQRLVLELADAVAAILKGSESEVRTVHIEQIQDLVQQTLADRGHHDVARRYRTYRQERHRARSQAPVPQAPLIDAERLTLRAADGSCTRLDLERLTLSIADVCQGLEDHVSIDALLRRTVANCVDGMPTSRMHEAILLAARPLIEQEPAYSFVAARILLRRLYREILDRSIALSEVRPAYPEMLPRAVARGLAAGRLDPRLGEFDLERLGRALAPERDLQFGYMGLQTLYDRYLLHVDGRRLETPQVFWMRIAMGLALNEGAQRTERAIEFYEMMSRFRFVPSTPTLFNAGTRHPQLSSCFLTTIHDDLDHIFKCIHDNAMLSKWSGGLGNDWTPVRALGSYIRGTNGKSQGIIPFMKVANDTAVAVNQGGKRQGATCAYLEVWHLDIEEFLELRKNTGDDRRRTHDMHTANWIPDLFMKRVLANADWTLLSPNEAPDLHDLYGRASSVAMNSTKRWRARASSSCSRWCRRCSCGARCWACFLKRAIRGSHSKIPRTSVRRKTTRASCTAPTSAPRFC